MSWQAVARKEFRDAIRSRWLHGSTLFFALFLGGASALFFGVLLGPESRQVSNLFGFFASLGVFSFSFPGLLALVLGFIALSTSYGSITEERETGSVKLLLSLPNSRLDVMIGKLLGRSAVVVAALLVGFLATFVILVATGSRLELGSFVPQVALTALLGAAFVSVGLSLSALADSNREATLATMGLYLVFAILWGSIAEGIPKLINYAAEQVGMSVAELTRVKIGVFLKYLNPLKTYETLAAQLYYGPAQARLVSTTFGERTILAPVLEGSPPFYFTGWFLFLVLLAWIVLPAAVGYWSFERADL
ncbi:ABC transporter permease [Halobellus clavatus]|jgi:ABC-2 type transport system permease protein|uniref:ABC-2 type transport system permease protein n=1 Tax=Halobellus clavatus TaxID=660517 RepID=A0A1H3EH90_9EURY|nr:ABC transporter permease [Halobellus clavatus]SDX77294.1 ABC-2 type transport system permease protein [Halobellus clavatus]